MALVCVRSADEDNQLALVLMLPVTVRQARAKRGEDPLDMEGASATIFILASSFVCCKWNLVLCLSCVRFAYGCSSQWIDLFEIRICKGRQSILELESVRCLFAGIVSKIANE